MEKNNFLGASNFVWWMGIVEDRVDPLTMGRCRVRIIGFHSDNKSVLPTNELPWATPIYPINNSKSFSSPMVNDWVMGFFMDGENAQFPYMLGVIPYIKEQ